MREKNSCRKYIWPQVLRGKTISAVLTNVHVHSWEHVLWLKLLLKIINSVKCYHFIQI